jgi:hypothetical protein
MASTSIPNVWTTKEVLIISVIVGSLGGIIGGLITRHMMGLC